MATTNGRPATHGVATVHTLKPDDPDRIEAYWHLRFVAKHKDGEWFDLYRPDVAGPHRPSSS